MSECEKWLEEEAGDETWWKLAERGRKRRQMTPCPSSDRDQMTRPLAQYSWKHVLTPYSIFVSTSQRVLKQTSTIRVNHWTWSLSKVKRLVNTRYMKLPPANTTRWLPWEGFLILWGFRCCCGLPVLEEAHFNTIVQWQHRLTKSATLMINIMYLGYMAVCTTLLPNRQRLTSASVWRHEMPEALGDRLLLHLVAICHYWALLLCWAWLTELSSAMTLFTVMREKNW